MNAELQTVCDELIAALLGGTAQGVLIVGSVWALLKVFRRANAATRHAAWFATLLVMAALPFVLFLLPRADRIKEAVFQLWPAAAFPAVVPAEAPAVAPIDADFEMAIAPLREAGPVADAAAATIEPTNSPWELALPAGWAPIIVGCWLALALIRLGALGCQLWALQCLRRQGVPAPESVAQPFYRVVEEMNVPRYPRLLLSDEIAAPMVAGFLRPAVLVPATVSVESEMADLESVFRHELAHVARGDDWANLLQQTIAAALFFHPGVLFASRRITAEREIACDDHALAALAAPRAYALFLTEFAGRMKGRDFTAAPAAWSSNSQLKERIGMILDRTRNASPRVSRAGATALTAATLALALAAFAAAPRVTLAAEDKPAEDSPQTAPAATATADVSVDSSSEAAIETTISIDGEPVKTRRVARARTASIGAVPGAPAAISARTAPATVATVTTPVAAATVTAIPSVDITPPRVKIDRSEIVLAAGHPHPPNVPQYAQPPQGHPGHVFPEVRPVPAPHPMPAPRPMPAPAPGFEHSHNEEVERRLERLERMVESLLGREKPGGGMGAKMRMNPDLHIEIDKKVQMEIERAHREAERGHREAERAQRDAERAVRDRDRDGVEKRAEMMARRAEEDRERGVDAARQSLQARRKALEAQHKAIEKQIEALEREAEKLEREKEARARQGEQEKLERQKKQEFQEKQERQERIERTEKEIKRRETDNKPSPDNSDAKPK